MDPEKPFCTLGCVWSTEDGSHIQLRALPDYKYTPNTDLIECVNPSEPPATEERPTKKQKQLGICNFCAANA